jgi:adenylosuccinate lyase
MMAAVKAGGDRQEIHEKIRRHSVAAAEQVKMFGKPNDLIARLSQDPAFKGIDIKGVLRPAGYIGRAPEQVDEFLAGVVRPILRKYRKHLNTKVELKV